MYAKGPYAAKYQFLINNQESTGLKHLNDSKPYNEYSNIWMIFIKILKNTVKKFIVCDNMIDDILSNKKLSPLITKLFIRDRKLDISLIFIIHTYFAAPKDISVNSTHYFVKKTPNKLLQQISFNHSSDIDFKDFMNLCKKCAAKLYSFLVIDGTLKLDNPSSFKKNLLERT